MHAATYSCATKQGARIWISRQVSEGLADPASANVALLNSAASVYTPALRRTTRYQCPLYIAPSAMAELFAMWNLSRECVIEAVRVMPPDAEKIGTLTGCRRAG